MLVFYARGEFVVNLALMDKEFDKIKDIIPFLVVNTTAAREHVGEIERYLREFKNRCNAQPQNSHFGSFQPW